ncbi:MlaD family protein [Mycolicibacterium xanthum]|uniref:MlaD family protein n=1 Tax=Mycolicibacterium xanthum TaxID=2796469 RepID=UPI002106E68D|nr:MlaD family protein [Mycolicibacterium xanthum]
MINAGANLIVSAVRAGHRRKGWLSAAALVMTLIVATGYLLVGALRVNPFASSYRVTVQLPESAGLLPNQDVTLRGVRIGRVDRLDITPTGVEAVVTMNSEVPVPVSSAVRVSGLSAAGEQYIDFQADSDAGPYLSDGAVIAQDRTTVPVSLAQLLADADGAREVCYQQLLESFRALELPAKSAALPAGYDEAVRYYDAMVRDELSANPFLRRVTRDLTRLPLPTLLLPPPLRKLLTPSWLVVRPLAGRVVLVCSFGILHPGVRELTGFRWRARHDREFALYTRLLQLAWRTLPDRVLLIPLARNRLEYEKLVRLHRSVGLESFAPPAGRCPAG